MSDASSRSAHFERWRSPLQVAAIIAAAVVSLATSPAEYPRCVYGSAPFDGQTQVPVEGPFVLVGRDLSDALPALGGTAFRLERLDEAGDVADAASVTVSRAGRHTVDGHDMVTWAIEPDAPLAPDARYRLVGIDLPAIESAHHAVGVDNLEDGYEWPAVERVFYTGSAPRLLAAVAEPPAGDVARVRLLFSEPMDIASLEGRIALRDLDDAPIEVVSGPTASESRPHVVTVEVGPGPWSESTLPTLSIEVDGEARGRSGVQLHGVGPLSDGLGAAGTPGRMAVTWDLGAGRSVGAVGVQYGGLWSSISGDVWFEALFDARPICEAEDS